MSDGRTLADALRAPAAAGGGRGSTSDLSIDEVLLLHTVGYEPVDLVFGVCWWSIPYGAFTMWQTQSGEIVEAWRAFSGAFDAAVRSMAAECQKVGGHGVLGVDVEVALQGRYLAVTLTGTAVRPVENTRRDRNEAPFLSDLATRDFALLNRAGWAPVGIAAGASYVVAQRRSAGQWLGQQGQNVELPNLTQALYQAREAAMARMQHMAGAQGADGVVGVHLRQGPIGQSRHFLQFMAYGSSVRLVEPSHRALSPSMVVTLNEPVRQFEATSLNG
jgi:uncharacterized protein YbjQ (UPF0145 family)